ncbi:MAG: hypothetical protein JW774_04790 [Candidatus Aureabacteria bacterium]|nr:hypothetical protein [Candidatus Auribacterota bacterium]
MNRLKSLSFPFIIGILLGINALSAFYYSMYCEPLTMTMDEPQYAELAFSLCQRGSYSTLTENTYFESGKPTAFRPPLYPLFLAGIIQLFGKENFIIKVRLVQAVLNLGILLAIFYFSFLLFSSRGISLIAMTLASGFMPFIYMSSHIMTETLSCLLVLATFISSLLVRMASRVNQFYWRSFFMGMLLGLSVLCRPNNIVLLLCTPCIFFSLIFSARQIFTAFFLSLLIFLSILGPWAMRNYLVLGSPVFLTTSGGINLYYGNNPHPDSTKGNLVPLPELPADIAKDEVKKDHYLTQAAFQFIRSNPQTFLKRIPLKLKSVFSPHLGSEYNSYSGRFFIVFFLLACLFHSYKRRIVLFFTFLFWIPLFSRHFYSIPSFVIFSFHQVMFGFPQLTVFIFVGSLLLVMNKKADALSHLPFLCYVLLTILLNILFLPKMRLRFVLDPYFIILSAYAMHWIWSHTRECAAFLNLRLNLKK